MGPDHTIYDDIEAGGLFKILGLEKQLGTVDPPPHSSNL